MPTAIRPDITHPCPYCEKDGRNPTPEQFALHKISHNPMSNSTQNDHETHTSCIDPVINPKKRYSPRFIGTHTCWILNSAGKPSHQFVLNEIKMGSLKAIPVPPKGVKKIILGAEIMRYRKERGY